MFDQKILTYLSSLFIGLFSSGILICAVAIITYFSERNKAIYQLYCACLDFSQALSFGKIITSRDEFVALKSEVNQAASIYNKDMQFLLDDLSALRKKSEIAKTIDVIRETSPDIYNAILELEEKITLVMCGQAEFADICNNKLNISSNKVMEATDGFTQSVNGLVTFIKHKKIHKWKESTNAE
jgi:hypothetical protein